VSTTDIVNVIQILIAIVMIGMVLLQAKGAGLGNIFGQEQSFNTRRGLEKSLFRGTIVLMIAFVGVSIAAVRV
jgi:protein translocase SecG subunit